MLTKEYIEDRPVCRVTFTLPVSDKAEFAYLVGDFNQWDEKATPMMHSENGYMVVTVELQRGREYQFRYLVDGNEWHNDWKADRYVRNEFNGDNSVVIT